MNEAQKKNFNRLRESLNLFARKCLYIKSKEATIIPLELNDSQIYFHQKLEEHKRKNGKIRVVVVKGRQQGLSTYTEARFTHKCMYNRGYSSFIVSEGKDSTDNIFEMVKRYYNKIPDGMPKPELLASNKKELSFKDIDSIIRTGTAGNKDVGVSTTNHLLHCCLSGDSLIVQPDGKTVSMHDIMVGDDVITSSGDAAPVSAKVFTGEKQTYELLSWVSGEPIYLTAEHKVKTIDGLKRLDQLDNNDYIAQPDTRPTNEISEYSFHIDNKERPQGGGVKFIEDGTFKLDGSFGYLIGYYLAEGHIRKGIKELCFTYHKDESFVLDAIKAIDGYYTSVSNKVDGNRGRTYVYGRFVSGLLNDICGRVDKKHIPEWFFKTNKDFLAGVLRGYLDGDGSKTADDRVVATSIHEKISRQMQRIVWALELGACTIRSKQDVFRYNKQVSDSYTIGMFGNTLAKYNGKKSSYRKSEKYKIVDSVVYTKIKSIKPRKIEPVWDIEVDHKDHDFQTTTGIVSNSEVGLWKNGSDLIRGLFQTVPNSNNSEIIIESTARGVGGIFHELAMAGLTEESNWETIFIPWFMHKEYTLDVPDDFKLDEEEQHLQDVHGLTDGQLAWRRWKIRDEFKEREWLFRQEYPCTVQEAFSMSDDGLIEGKYIDKARKTTLLSEKQLPVVAGVDPARKGGDRTVIALRRGREVFKLIKYDEMTQMELAGILGTLINDYSIVKLFMDVAHGYGTIDRLDERGFGHIVEGIPFNQQASKPDVYANKRAEMFGNLRDWFMQDGSVSIPDNEELATDFASLPDMAVNSSSRFIMPPKEDIKKELGRSPDMADAVALTLCENIPIIAENSSINYKRLNKRKGR